MQKPNNSSQDIAIIIPVFNEPPAFIDQLDRLISAKVFREIIVVTSALDLSENTTFLNNAIKQRQQHQPSLQWLCLEEKGRAYQMNNGASAASCRTLLFLHADTAMDEKKSSEEINHAVAQGFDWGRFNINITTDTTLKAWQKLAFFSIASLINLRSKYTKIATGDQAIFINRELFLQLGCFDNLPLMEDVALCKKLKVKKKSPYCSKVRVNTSARRWLNHGILRTVVLMWRIRYRYWQGASAESLAALYKEAR